MTKKLWKRENSLYKKINNLFAKLSPGSCFSFLLISILSLSLNGCKLNSAIFKNSDQYQTSVLEADIYEIGYVAENEINALTSLEDRAEVETETIEGNILIKKINGVANETGLPGDDLPQANRAGKSWKLYVNGELIEKAPGTVILKNKDLVEWKFQAQ